MSVGQGVRTPFLTASWARALEFMDALGYGGWWGKLWANIFYKRQIQGIVQTVVSSKS